MAALMAACFAAGLYFLFSGRLFAAVVMALVEGVAITLRFPRLSRLAEKEPAAVYLRRPEAPLLFNVVEGICRDLGISSLSRLYLGHDCDLYAGQYHRSGYLYLGMPLLYSADVEDFRTLMTLALAQSSSADSSLVSHARNVQLSCAIWQQRIRDHSLSLLRPSMEALLEHYAAKIAALADGLERCLEQRCDEQVANLVGHEAVARALICFVLTRRCFDQFWADASQEASSTGKPHRSIYRLFATDVRERMAQLRRPELTDLLYSSEDPQRMTHRLANLGLRREQILQLASQVSSPAMGSAAQAFLEGSEVEIRSRMEEHWAIAIAPVWRQLHRYRAESERAHA